MTGRMVDARVEVSRPPTSPKAGVQHALQGREERGRGDPLSCGIRSVCDFLLVQLVFRVCLGRPAYSASAASRPLPASAI